MTVHQISRLTPFLEALTIGLIGAARPLVRGPNRGRLHQMRSIIGRLWQLFRQE